MPPSNSSLTDAWVQVRVPGRDAQSMQVEIRFNPAYVQSFWRAAAESSTRAGYVQPELEKMLMEDTFKLQDETVYVAAWLEISPKDTEQYRLRVDIDAPGSIPRDVFVTLHWNGVLHEVKLPRNTARVMDKSRRRFSKWFAEIPSSEFRLTFEYRDSSQN